MEMTVPRSLIIKTRATLRLNVASSIVHSIICSPENEYFGSFRVNI